MFCEPHDDVIN